MRLERSKKWWLARARLEGDTTIGAGLLARDPEPEEDLEPSVTTVVEETRIAFGRFIRLMRRRRGVSVEQLATEADLDARELLIIEDDVHYLPEPRTVFRLALTFRVSQQLLMQLAGLAVACDPHLRQEAVRFAARSEPVQKLTPEQNAALEAFVAVLSQQDPKKVT